MPLFPRRVLCSTTLLVSVLAGLAPAVAAPPTAAPAPDEASPRVWADPPPTPSLVARVSGATGWTGLSAQALEAAAGDVLALHSLPGSRRTIFIDVDGGVVAGTMWNDQGVPTSPTPGWDLSRDGASVLSAVERDAVAEVWARVAEDFAPFDVDVTTEDPGAAAITRSGLADQVFGTRVVVTRDPIVRAAIDSCRGTCGGAAADDVFDRPVDHERFQPAWVFPQALGEDPKYVAEAVSHEVGHTFGLSHDDRAGDADVGYYAGHAGWGPIMGSAYAQAVTQWSRGSYAGATNQEDDLAVIAAGGAPLRADEGPALPGPGQVSYISGPDDLDVYRLRDCAGVVTVDASVADVGPDLDVELRLQGLDERLLDAADPPSLVLGRTVTGLGATLRRSVPRTPADYLLVVDGSGRDGTTATTGYDDYGSVGAYRLAVTGCGIATGSPGAPGVPAVSFAGTTATLTWTAPASTGGSRVTAYDVLVDGVRRTTTVGRRATVRGLERGRSYRFQVAARNASGSGTVATRVAVVPPGVPGAPRVVRARSGAPGGVVSATITWTPPRDDGGAEVTHYRLTGYQLDRWGRVVWSETTDPVAASTTTAEVRMPAGTYRIAVAARNSVGWGPLGARSVRVTAR